MVQPNYDFAPIGDNIPRVTAVLRDLCRRLLKGVEGGEHLPEWAEEMVSEAMASAGMGGHLPARRLAEPTPALTGGNVVQDEESGVNARAETIAEADAYCPDHPEPPVVAAGEDDVTPPPAEEEEPADADGTASDIAGAPSKGVPVEPTDSGEIRQTMLDGADEI